MSVAAQAPAKKQAKEISFATLLLVASGIFAVFALLELWTAYAGSSGILSGPGSPFGGDFVNLWSAGQLVLNGAIEAIYRPDAFMAYELTHSGGEDIGFRVWAYPPQSLLFAWPFGLAGYFVTFAAWSVLGLVVLAAGARRFGFNWVETSILVLSPAALSCIYFGQTGNIATGLLLFALAGRDHRSIGSIASAAALTVKPQAGFLLALLWLTNRRWSLIAATSAATLLLIGLSIALFGMEAWRDYAGLTLPELSDLERNGSGPFTLMIPTMFMSMRLAGFDGDTAIVIHFAFAAAVLAFLIWRLRGERDPMNQAALVLIGTCLITPYLHLYDLGILMAGALIIMRGVDGLIGGKRLAVVLAVGAAWALPKLVMMFGTIGVPVSPLLVLGILAVACLKRADKGEQFESVRTAGSLSS